MSDTTASHYSYRRAVIILEKTDQEIDVSQAIGELILTENIRSLGISGNVLIVDSSNLFSRSNFSGTEILEIDLYNHQQDKSIKKRFVMYKTDSISVVNDTTMTYVFSLMTEHVFKSHLKAISKSYTGTPLQIIKRILDGQMGVTLDTTKINGHEPIQQSMSIVTPYISPIESANWVLNSLTTNEGFPYFLFGSIKSDDIYLTNLKDIIDAEPLFNTPFVKSGAIASNNNPGKSLFTIEDISYSNNNNTLSSIVSGAMGAKFEVLDTVYGNRSENPEFRLNEVLPDTKVVDGEFVVDEKRIVDYESNFIFNVVAPSQIGEDGYGYDEDVNKLKSKIKRKSVLRALDSRTATMQVTGILFMELETPTIGGKIKIEVTSMEGDVTILDEQKSGEFIISSIRHSFFDEKHRVTLGVSKL